MEATLPAQRRTRRFLTANDFLKEVRNLSLDWPGKTVRLERDSLSDHWQRPASNQPAIAELYHENSKLFDAVVGDLVGSRTNVEQLRDAVAAQRSEAMHTGSWPPIELPEHVQRMLEAVLDGIPKSALFAFDLRAATAGVLVVFEPVRKVAYAVKKITPSDLAAVWDALALIGPRTSPQPDGVLIFLVASFARNQMLYGSRGYRRTLVEAGRLIEHMQRYAAVADCASRLWLEFADRRIDAFAEADGVEEGTLAVMEMRWNADADNS